MTVSFSLMTCISSVIISQQIAAQECEEKLGVSTYKESRGRVFIDVNVVDVPKVTILLIHDLGLKSNVSAILKS